MLIIPKALVFFIVIDLTMSQVHSRIFSRRSVDKWSNGKVRLGSHWPRV